MPILLDIANELLQKIIDQIYHKDLVNLAMTCRHINKLSQLALKRHQGLLSKYSVVSNTVRRGGVLAKLTANILRDPRIGLYVSRLNIDGWFTKWRAPDLGSDLPVHNEYPKDTMHVVGEAGAIIEVLFKSEIDTWLGSLKDGDEDAVIALLLLYLPNLETLSLEAASDCKFLHLALEYAQGRSDQGRLSRLHSVNLVSEGLQSFEIFQDFARIPCVRVIRASWIRNWGDPMLVSPTAGECKLESLLFSHCRLESKALHSFIVNTSGLRCFSFVFEEIAFASADLYWIRAGLSTTANDTLEYLQLIRCRQRSAVDHQSGAERSEGDSTQVTTSSSCSHSRRPCLHEDNGDPYIGSLRNFNILKTLILNWEFLVDGGSDPGRYSLAGRFPMATFLARQLPSSIRNLMLLVKSDTERGTQSVPYLKRALKELLNESKARLPDLKIIRIVGMSRLKMGQLSASMLVKNYQGAGISLSFTAAEDASDIEKRLQSCGYYDKVPWAPSILP